MKKPVITVTKGHGISVYLENNAILFFETPEMLPKYIVQRPNGFSFLNSVPISNAAPDFEVYDLT